MVRPRIVRRVLAVRGTSWQVEPHNKLAVIEKEAKETEQALLQILKQLGVGA